MNECEYPPKRTGHSTVAIVLAIALPLLIYGLYQYDQTHPDGFIAQWGLDTLFDKIFRKEFMIAFAVGCIVGLTMLGLLKFTEGTPFDSVLETIFGTLFGWADFRNILFSLLVAVLLFVLYATGHGDLLSGAR